MSAAQTRWVTGFGTGRGCNATNSDPLRVGGLDVCQHGRTALMEAVVHGHAGIVEALAKRGSVTCKDNVRRGVLWACVAIQPYCCVWVSLWQGGATAAIIAAAQQPDSAALALLEALVRGNKSTSVRCRDSVRAGV